jgi:flagellar hook-length control protein FliK
MGTEISGIVKGILQIKANLKTGSLGKEPEQDFSGSFMELMSRNGLSNMNAAADSKQMQFYADAAQKSGTPYDAYTGTAKNISIQKTATPEEVQTEAADALQAYEEEIRSILKDELGVTDEEISAAMEALGMNILDVRNLQDLALLVQELTGQDIGTLFASDVFQNIMEQVMSETEALCGELGVTKEEWNLLCEAWDQTEQVEVSDMESVTESKGEQLNPVISDENGLMEENPANITLVKEQTETADPEEGAGMNRESEKIVEETKSAEEMNAGAKDEAESSSADEQGLMDRSRDGGKNITHAEHVFAEQQSIRIEEFILPEESVQPYTSQVDAFDLIDQIAKNVRVTISAAETSMEMQLNPENLGKLYLNISEREGVIRAQITVQNAAVKEALEVQLVELRQSLNQQGIKVDAIEVTVGAHEFEQNLEENAREEEQMQQQMQESKKGTRRSLNLNELDGLSGLMSEEEQLAAQIMKDNGNQVDLTA